MLNPNEFERAKIQVFDAGKRIWSTKGEQQEEAKKDLLEALKVLEGELGDKPYFGGQTFGYLDLALITFYSWFYAYETCGNFKIEPECPKLIVWVNRCLLKDSVAKSLPDGNKVYEFVLALKKALGIP